MILEKLKVKNFRQYYGEQELEFATGSKNVTVINGSNGAGKTNLFSAINWCLYGPVGNGSAGELVNKRALSEAAGKKIDADVELRFRHVDSDGESTSYVAYRSTRDPQILSLSRVSRKGLEDITNPILVLNTILPSNVRTYFFFDGEKIDDFAKPEHEAEVKDAVYSVLQLQILERAQGHLTSIGDEYERDLKKLDPDEALTRAIEDRQEKAEEKKQAESELDTARKEVHAAQLLVKALDAELLKQADIRSDVKRRQELESQKTEYEQNLDEITDNLKDLGTTAYLILGRNAIRAAISTIDEKRNRGEIPSGIREQFIRDLLEKAICVCGRSLGPAEITKFEELITKAIPSNLENKLLETGGLLRAIEARSEDALRAISTEKRRKAELEEKLNQVIREQDEITTRLSNKGEQNIEALEAKRADANRKASELLIDIGRHEENIRRLDKEIRSLEDDLKRAQGLQGKAKLIQEKLALSRGSARAISEVYELFGKLMRDKIQKEAQEIFSKLVWKESQFTKVELSDDYHLSVLDRWGMPARPELSAGERQLLSLAFIVALSRANGADSTAPMVMDTPFGRLDTIPRENICRHLPRLVEQFVLFVTGEELHGTAREVLAGNVGREYSLDWNKSTGCTRIVDGRLGRGAGA